MADTIVPFGKYKGQPVEAMAADKQYLDWLTAQPWFREKFQNIYTLVVNNLQEPTETPEHNKLQALFLDDAFRRRFLTKIHGDRVTAEGDSFAQFESEGFDVRVFLELKKGSCPECHVEIKPSIGDDYPAVLRQINRARTSTRQLAHSWKPVYETVYAQHPALFIEKYTGVGATEEQFIQIFESAGIHVIFLDEMY